MEIMLNYAVQDDTLVFAASELCVGRGEREIVCVCVCVCGERERVL